MHLDGPIFYTHDVNRAIRFYRDVIGLALDNRQGDRFVTFRFENNVKLGIKKASESREHPGAGTIMIRVHNTEQFHASFKSEHPELVRGDFEVRDFGKYFAIKDPDLNQIEFIESR